MIQFIHESDRELFETAIAFGQKQVKRLIETYPDFYPMYTAGGAWKHAGPVWTHWCDGFLPGMMWLFLKHMGTDKPESKYWMEQAIRYSKPLEPRKTDREVQDLGFHLLFDLLPLVSIHPRSRDTRSGDSSWPHAGAALQRSRPVSALVCGGRFDLHRHHDERRNHLLRGARNER